MSFVDPYQAIGAFDLDYLHPSQFKDVQIHPMAAAHAVASIFAALHPNYEPLSWSHVSGQPMTVADPVTVPTASVPSGETPAGTPGSNEPPVASVPSGETPAGTPGSNEGPVATVPSGETPAGTPGSNLNAVNTPNYSEIGAQATFDVGHIQIPSF